jgi:hypothetical protein
MNAKDSLNWGIWLGQLQHTFQEVVEPAMEAEYFSVITLFDRFVKHKKLGSLEFMTALTHPEKSWSAHDEWEKVDKVMRKLKLEFSLEDLRTSDANRPEYIQAPLVYYFWLYLFWSAMGPENILSTKTVHQMLRDMIEIHRTENKIEFETRVRLDESDKREPLIPYLLFELDRFVTTWRYEKANTRDGKVQVRSYLQ